MDSAVISVNLAETWTYRPAKKSIERGVQIDLLIDRADNCINLCEIKYIGEKFLIDKDYAEEFLSKRRIFIGQVKTNKSFLGFHIEIIY